MPASNRSSLGGARSRGIEAGGTTVSASRGGLLTWLTPLVGLAVLIGLVVLYFVGRSSSDQQAEPAQPAQATEVATEPEEEPAPPPGPEDEQPVVAPEQQGPTPAEVARKVGAELDGARLWSNVEVDGDALVIRSGECATPAMVEVLSANLSLLTEGGMATIRCLERHGAVAFERSVADLAEPEPAPEPESAPEPAPESP